MLRYKTTYIKYTLRKGWMRLLDTKLEERKERIKGFLNDRSYHPLTFDELVVSLDVPKEDIELFRQCLEELEEEGYIYRTKKNRYVAPEKIGLVPGTFQGHERGYGFVVPDDPNQSDVFIQSDRVKGAMHGDRVVARIIKFYADDRHSEGEIVKILSRAHEKIVGTFEKSFSVGYVIPDLKKIKGHIIVPLDKSMGAKPHQKVVVEITRYPEPERNAEGQVVEILGDADEKGVDALSVLRAYKIPVEFPDEVINEAKSIPQQLTEADYKGRRDLRNLTMVTIDGEDARDLDDAVSLEITENGNYLLGVHIADVSHYVKENSPLDREALKRGTSVYFPDMVIPMLPKELSNGICSLNPQVDRLAFSVFMEIDSLGRVINHEIVESVINVNERMTYTNVYKILEEHDPELIERYKPLVPMFEKMKELALILRKRRGLRGAIDFDFEEAKIVLDENGKPIKIGKYEITIANKIIEEFMLLCNETVSEHFYWADIPFVYRIHEDPDPEKIRRLNEFLFNFGVRIKGSGNVHPRALQDVLAKVKGTPQERVISTMMLRSLQKARYSDEHTWHFGLAADYYSHFTSPIRRYPDLIIHRIMKEYIHGRFDEKRNEYYSNALPNITKHCSERERSAEEAEREYEDLKKAEYMQQHIGETFNGIVSSITSFGMFVELDNTVEGLVRLTSMDDDFYDFDEKLQVLIGVRTGKVYRIGDVVEVVVANADPKTRQIDFILAGNVHEPDLDDDTDDEGNNGSKRSKSGKTKKKNVKDQKVIDHINGRKRRRK